ncbi:MAG: hypothetical protein JNL54_14020 [Kineosporiaceae bacterium]|nr:hypothetical protein [Kineosporiaceae bacterium]
MALSFGWGVIHSLSEIVHVRDSGNTDDPRVGGIVYPDLRGFSVRQLHDEGISQSARQEQQDWERADEYLSDAAAREYVLASGNYPPSAYDFDRDV